MLLDGSTTVDDIGVGFQTTSTQPTGTTFGAATIVDAQTVRRTTPRPNSRTTTQVLQIVTGVTAAPPAGTRYAGVFFPTGLNGLFS